MDADRAALSSARPAFEVGGEARPALDSGLLRLVLADSVHGLATLEAEFGNWGNNSRGGQGFLWFDRSVLDFGKAVLVKIGSETVFDGAITALEARYPSAAPPTLVLRADDKLQSLRMTRRTRTFERVSDADIVRRIAGEYGLQADVNLGSGPTWPLVVQSNQSDLAFLRRRMLVADGDLVLAGTRLTARSRASRQSANLTLVQGGRLRRFQVAADLAHQRTALSCAGWDVAGKQALNEAATASAVSSEASGGDSGPQVLQRAFGDRKDMLGHRAPLDSAGARAEAEAHMRALARRFVRGRGEADADARLRPGATVDLDGLGALFNGRYGIAEVWHRFDLDAGLRSEFSVERAWLGRP
jgi:phage protein D